MSSIERLHRDVSAPSTAPRRGVLTRGPTTQDGIPSSVRRVLGTSGRPLDPAPRSTFERQLGRDLGTVRVHTDQEAATSAADMAARAYTVARHVVFDEHEYQPGTVDGDALLQHELGHVAQQWYAAGSPVVPGSSSPQHERRAYPATGPVWARAVSDLPEVTTPVLMKWDSPEHVALGDEAAGSSGALITLDCHDRDFPERGSHGAWPAPWRQRLAAATPEQARAVTRGLTYGEVVALSGDFYDGIEPLNQAPLTEIFTLIPLIRSGATTGQLQAATGGRYLAMAAKNISHFSAVPAGQDNLSTWRQMHAQAILAGRQGRTDPALANRAWATNAAADHFLTDAFSGGHLRTPRAALMQQGVLGNVESKIEHDLDNTFGVEVTNDRRDPAWIAYGDEHLDSAANTTNRARALEAVELSRKDVADAITGSSQGPMPATFPSERLVPRPISPATDRWSGRTPQFVAGPGGTVSQVSDDYTRMRDDVIRREAPNVIRGALWSEDDDVRSWVGSHDLAAISRQPGAEKIRMIDTVLGGFLSWISDDDVATIERICLSVATGGEMAVIRNHFAPDLPSRMTSIGQRTRVRIALNRL